MLTGDMYGAGAHAVEDAVGLGQQLHRIAVSVFEHQSYAYDPFLESYCGNLRDPLASVKLAVHVADLLDLAGVDVSGKAVLDVGCGFGFALVLCGLLGAEQLHGLEIHEGMIRTIGSYRHLLPSPIQQHLYISRGDAARMPYEAARFDAILSIEAVSHYLEVGRFAAEAARVLKPGGVLIVSDGNNGMNPFIRRRNHRIWAAFERGPSDRFVDNYPVGTCYEERRRAFIDKRCPQMGESDRARLARETFSMTFDQVAEACDCFLERGVFPGRRFRRGAMPIDPDGSVPERLLHPYRLARALELCGFEAQVYGYWGGANGRPVVRALNRSLMRLSTVTICSARAVRVVGVKREGAPSGA